ncbi:hypothetical protein HDU91_006512, partial [Kappamyces sp. JEL0680]
AIPITKKTAPSNLKFTLLTPASPARSPERSPLRSPAGTKNSIRLSWKPSRSIGECWYNVRVKPMSARDGETWIPLYTGSETSSSIFFGNGKRELQFDCTYLVQVMAYTPGTGQEWWSRPLEGRVGCSSAGLFDTKPAFITAHFDFPSRILAVTCTATNGALQMRLKNDSESSQWFDLVEKTTSNHFRVLFDALPSVQGFSKVQFRFFKDNSETGCLDWCPLPSAEIQKSLLVAQDGNLEDGEMMSSGDEEEEEVEQGHVPIQTASTGNSPIMSVDDEPQLAVRREPDASPDERVLGRSPSRIMALSPEKIHSPEAATKSGLVFSPITMVSAVPESDFGRAEREDSLEKRRAPESPKPLVSRSPKRQRRASLVPVSETDAPHNATTAGDAPPISDTHTLPEAKMEAETAAAAIPAQKRRIDRTLIQTNPNAPPSETTLPSRSLDGSSSVAEMDAAPEEPSLDSAQNPPEQASTPLGSSKEPTAQAAPDSADNTNTPNAETSAVSESQQPIVEVPKKRGRGRPRKSESANPSSAVKPKPKMASTPASKTRNSDGSEFEDDSVTKRKTPTGKKRVTVSVLTHQGPKKKEVQDASPGLHTLKPGRKSLSELDLVQEFDGPPGITVVPEQDPLTLPAKPDVNMLGDPSLPFYYSLRFGARFDLQVDGSWYTGRALYYYPNSRLEWELYAAIDDWDKQHNVALDLQNAEDIARIKPFDRSATRVRPDSLSKLKTKSGFKNLVEKARLEPSNIVVKTQALNRGETLLSMATVEPFWSTGTDIFKRTGVYSRLCLLLVLLTSWSFLSGFLLPIGILRPTKCPYNPTTGPMALLELSPIAYATGSGRLATWYNYYSSGLLPPNVLIGVYPNATKWVYVPEMYAGSLNCAQVESPPTVVGSIALQQDSVQLTHNDSSFFPAYVQRATGWPDMNMVRSGYNYEFLPDSKADANGNQVLAWASGLGMYGYSVPAKPRELDVLITLLGTRQQVPLWNSNAAVGNASFTFNRNYAYVCRVRWDAQPTNVILYDPLKASAVVGNTFHGAALDGPLSPDQIISLQQLAASVIVSQFGPSAAVKPDVVYGREISCLTQYGVYQNYLAAEEAARAEKRAVADRQPSVKHEQLVDPVAMRHGTVRGDAQARAEVMESTTPQPLIVAVTRDADSPAS